MPQDLNRFFQVEAEDLLDKITAALEQPGMHLEREEQVRELRRWVHTMKGAAQVVRREDVARAAHELETELNGLADAQSREEARQAGLKSAAALRELLMPAVQTATPSSGDAASVRAPEPAEIETLRIELGDLDGLLQAVNESSITASEVRKSLRALAHARDLAALIRAEGAAGHVGHAAHPIETLADELEDALVEIRRDLEASSERIFRGLDELRARAEELRLVRAEAIVHGLEQAVRAAAADSGKLIRFESSGGELEFDAHLLIAARDALVQIVRNAVAHGIEGPDERAAAGKPASGHIRVAFRHDGSRNLFEVSDDGRGIDFEWLRREAIARGWMSAEEAQAAGARELTDLLLRPGVTTSASADVLSGRGVGLDVVRRTVARLKGDLMVKALPGEGTTFVISAPASMISMAALIVGAGAHQVGIPRDAVRRTVAVRSLEKLGDRYVLDGRPLPLVSLTKLMGGEDGEPTVAAEIEALPQPFLLGLDATLGIRQIVLHTLPEFVETEPFVLGASVNAAGQVVPVVSPLRMGPRISEELRAGAATPAAKATPLPILVVDDSLTTRMLQQSIFEMEGYSVELARSAEEALAMAGERAYGLFLVDVEMPGMDGVAFVEKTRQDPALRETPAILVTSRGSAEDRERGLKAGAREYIVKSEFDQRHLIRRVRELIRTER